MFKQSADRVGLSVQRAIDLLRDERVRLGARINVIHLHKEQLGITSQTELEEAQESLEQMGFNVGEYDYGTQDHGLKFSRPYPGLINPKKPSIALVETAELSWLITRAEKSGSFTDEEQALLNHLKIKLSAALKLNK